MTIHIDYKLNVWVNGKTVYFTMHVRDEIDNYGTETLFVCEVIDKGEMKLVSKKENRYESRLAIGDTIWVVIWFDMDDRILVKHLGKEKR